jgi:hypothetical protein
VAANDGLSKLAQRSKEAEDNVQATATRSRAELQSKVDQARDNAKEHADSLHAKNAQARDDISGQWAQVQDNWNKHLSKVRDNVADKRAAHDVREAEKNAQWAKGTRRTLWTSRSRPSMRPSMPFWWQSRPARTPTSSPPSGPGTPVSR